MKSYIISAILLVSIFCIIGASLVFADGYKGWSAITTGYAVTSNYQGKDVPPGQTVVVTAGTTDLSITNIVFRWHDPDNNTVWQDNVNVEGPLTAPNVPSNVPQEVKEWANNNIDTEYLYAQSSHAPTTIGDWGVQVFFIGEDGKTKAGIKDTISIRATSFNVIPDVPVLGTAGATIAMALGLGLYLKRRKQPSTKAINM